MNNRDWVGNDFVTAKTKLIMFLSIFKKLLKVLVKDSNQIFWWTCILWKRTFVLLKYVWPFNQLTIYRILAVKVFWWNEKKYQNSYLTSDQLIAVLIFCKKKFCMSSFNLSNYHTIYLLRKHRNLLNLYFQPTYSDSQICAWYVIERN